MRCPSRPGFTLIELMIGLALLAILATIAIPSYQQQVLQARRTDGQAGLMAIAIAQERFRAHCTQYAQRLSGTRDCASETTSSYTLGVSDASPEGYYHLSLDSVSASGFNARATASGPQARDREGDISCKVLGLDQDGNRTPRACW
ncbi:pilus assembly protein [Thiorhodococcus drewsii AZ1]|uniref:Pilus assembly protein n=2 Tax=Thiorhodococcus drewsii TaxID=210408 RepID=G2DY67_9GAMM|nr:pilus assembly protein [Thiorhodococcus drewsii AZ1]